MVGSAPVARGPVVHPKIPKGDDATLAMALVAAQKELEAMRKGQSTRDKSISKKDKEIALLKRENTALEKQLKRYYRTFGPPSSDE
jgi:hypothetical protein